MDQEHNPLPLSNQSLLLLLVLANLTDGPEWPNPYRQAITCFRNTQGNICIVDILVFLIYCTCWLHIVVAAENMLICMTCAKNDLLILIILASPHADTSSLPVEQPHTFQINFNSLYTALCEQQRSDQATLLLYTLLHQNANMRTYMLSRTDMDNLVGRNAAMKRLCSFTECGAHTCMYICLSEFNLRLTLVSYWEKENTNAITNPYSIAG